MDYDNAVEIVELGKYDDEHFAADLAQLSPLDALKYLLDHHGMNSSQLGELLGNNRRRQPILHPVVPPWHTRISGPLSHPPHTSVNRRTQRHHQRPAPELHTARRGTSPQRACHGVRLRPPSYSRTSSWTRPT